MFHRLAKPLLGLALIVVTTFAVQAQADLQPGDQIIFTADFTTVYAYPTVNSSIVAVHPQGYVDRLGPAAANTDDWIFLTEQVGYIRRSESSLEKLTDETQIRLIEAASDEIAQNPTDSDAFVRRATIYVHRDEYEAAIADYSAAIELAPTEGVNYARRGRTYRLIRDYEQAIADYQQAVELGETGAWTLTGFGVTYERIDDYDEAERWYLQALAQYPDSFYGHNNMGALEHYRRNYQQAIVYYDQATAINPYGHSPYANRALTYKNQENIPAAREELLASIAINPYNPRAYVDAANLFAFQLHDSAAALGYIDEALNIDAEFSDAFEERAVIYAYEVYDSSSASADFLTAIELDPYNIGAIDRGGIFFARIGNFEKARELYDQLAALDARHSHYYLFSAQIYFGLGDYENAKQEIATFEEICQLDASSDLAWAFLIKGMTALQEGDYTAAFEHYDFAFSYYTEYTKTWLEKKGFRLIDSRIALAQTYMLGIQNTPDDPENYLQLAHILMEFGVWTEALDYYHQYLDMEANAELQALVDMIEEHLSE